MDAVIIYLTFITWLLNYLLRSKNALKEINFKKDPKYLNWFKKNFKIMPLLLILLFIFFMNFDNEIVNKILFFTINLYLYIDLIHEDKISKKKLKFTSKNKIIFLLILLISIIPFIYFYLTKNLSITYLLLFIYSYFAYLLVLIMLIIDKKITKYLSKKNNIKKKN